MHFFVLSLAPNMQGAQFLNLSNFIDHYQEHLERNENSNLISFIQEHYFKLKIKRLYLKEHMDY
jgi:hypothetical protein